MSDADDRKRIRREWLEWASALSQQSVIANDEAFGRLSRTIAYPFGDAPTEWSFEPLNAASKRLTIFTDGDSDPL